MKKNIFFLLPFCLIMLSCEKETTPSLSLNQSESTLSDAGGTQTISIESNMNWSATASESWCTVSPASGDASTKSTTVTVAKNESYGARRCNVIITAGGLSKIFTIHQYHELAYYVRNMGTLDIMLNQTQKDTITTMILKGQINAADFEVMKNKMPKLRYLDLKEVKCEDDKIPDGAFGRVDFSPQNTNITTIILPLSITSIGEFAFMRCSGLSGELNLPAGLKSIGKYAFNDCPGFTGTLSLPEGLSTIEEHAFEGCTGFTGSLFIPNGLKTIDDFVFAHCSGLSGSLSLPDGLNSIGVCAFYNCSGLNGSLNLPAGLTTIGEQAFDNCSGFTGPLNLPAGLTTISGWTFRGCTGLSGSLILPKGLTTIKRHAFYGCSGFTGTLNLPEGLTTIESAAFHGCTGFTGLVFGNSIDTIVDSAFKNCINITGNVIFPQSLNFITEYGFQGCDKVEAFRFPHATPLPYYPLMLPRGATVEVPTAAVATYKATYGWNDYNIVGY